MKHPKTTITLTIAFSIAFFILGILTFGQLLELLLPRIDGITYSVTEIGGGFRAKLLFSLALGLAPLSLFLVWRLTPIASANKKLISIGIVLACMIIALIFRQQMLRVYFTMLPNSSTITMDRVSLSYPINEVHFEYYLFLGLCTGIFISVFSFRKKLSPL